MIESATAPRADSIPENSRPSAATLPGDPDDERLVANVRPPQWLNPRPRGRYNPVVIGGGTAGLVCAAGAAGLGAKVAQIESQALGGDCLNSGCVPSKAVLRVALAAYEARTAPRLGVEVGDARVDFRRAMERMRRLLADVSKHDSAERFRKLGVDVYLGQARFVSDDQVAVGDTRLRFARAVVATGARSIVPDIEGLTQSGFVTNHDVFSRNELPRCLLVLGGGPIGCELVRWWR